MKKLLSIFLALLMCLALLPQSSVADEGITRNDAVNWARDQVNRSASSCDVDGNGLWCTDLATAYINYCWLRTNGDYRDPWGLYPYTTKMAYAYDDYLADNPNWTIITRTASTVPQPGDLFVSETDSAGYGYGHVGVILSVNGSYSAEIIEMSGGVPPTINNVVWGSTASYNAQHFIRFNYYKQTTFTVTYDANGGTGAPASQTKTAGQALTLSTTKPKRASSSAGNYTVKLNANGGKVDTASLTADRTTNYTFKNWNTAKNGSGTSYSSGGSYTTDANVTLYAQWNSSTTTAAITLPTPYYYGYYFRGWATSSSASSGVTGSYTPSGNCTLYATWEKEDLSGWSDEKPDNIYDDLIETATEYRYADRTVTSSWTQTDSGTIDYAESWPSGFDQSHSLYSQYHHKPKTVGVSGNKKIEASTAANGFIYWHWCFNNGSLSSGNYNVYISDTPYFTDEAGRYYQYFTALKSNTDAGHYDPNNRYGGDDGYYLWRDTPSDGSWWWYRIPVYRQTYTEYTGGTSYGDWSDWSCWTMIVYPTGDTRKSETKTVYRYKENIAVILTFNANGGTCSTSEKTVIPGEKYGTLPTPTRTGYSFGGWYTDAENGSRVTETTRITTRSDHSLYAHWTKTGVTVTFNANGGSVSPSSKTVMYGSTYGDLPTPTRTGYTFNGWFTAASGGSQVTSSTTVTNASNHTLYAQWSKIPSETVTVYFNANGGNVSTSSKTVTVGSTYGTLPTPTQTGYTFDGWYTAASGGTKINASTTVTTASDHTLYAHWTGKTYTVTFNATGGSVSTSSKTVTFGNTYGDLPTPTRTGYKFEGWYTSASNGTRVTATTTVTLAGNHTLYAHWTGKTYTVTFNATGGSVSTSSKTVTFGSAYGTLPTASRTGYTFKGWYTSASGGTNITATTTVALAGNHTLYAHWSEGGEIPDTFDGWIEWNEEDVAFKGSTPYVIADGWEWEPRFTVYDEYGNEVDESCYEYEYRENVNAGTGYVIVTFTSVYSGTAQAWFKIYLPATTDTKVENVKDGIKISWEPVEGADGYVIYRRAWSSTTNGWTTFERWNNTPDLTWTDTNVYAGTRYQYGIKGYFARRIDPVSGAEIGGNVGDNYNLGIVGPLKTTVRITTRTLKSVTAGSRSFTAIWDASQMFTGYQIKYSIDGNFSNDVKSAWVSNWKIREKTISSLQSGKTYYVCVRSYHVFEGVTYYGQWSNVLSCKVK